MIKFLDKKNNYDFVHQFQWLKGSEEIKLKLLYVDTNNNMLIKNSNLIYPTYYCLSLYFNQKPLIKTTKKSIANFNIRPNMNLGIRLTLNKNSLFFNNFFYNLNSNLTSSSSSSSSSSNINKNNNISYTYKNQKYNIIVNYGVKNFNSSIDNIKHYNYMGNFGGGNLIFNLVSPVKFVPFYYLV